MDSKTVPFFDSMICSSCQKPVEGEVIRAEEKIYHPEHFVCFRCQAPLLSSNYYTFENSLYCSNCVVGSEISSSKKNIFLCATCKQPINGNMVTVQGKSYHPEHFFCVVCEKILASGEKYYSHLDQPYCVKHYFFNVVCQCACGCGQTTKDSQVLYGAGRTWIPEHFTCFTCQKQFKEKEKFYQVTSETKPSTTSTSPPSSFQTTRSDAFSEKSLLLNFCSEKHFFQHFSNEQTLPRPYVVKKRVLSLTNTVSEKKEEKVPSLQNRLQSSSSEQPSGNPPTNHPRTLR
eukprot:TRINITY_DN7559_c0_g1_i1.p1 TRINITY_DN7559_c0_g1~~TRINITY_DN7559_c0_g1_i1.p1  ORF type:complete len:312 (-),score=81.46 TRINITY_DN7559_c0_g1_i1:2-865(-)